MTFESEETQGKFHELPAQTQLDYCGFEIELARKGQRLHILDVNKDAEGELQVVVRIDQKL